MKSLFLTAVVLGSAVMAVGHTDRRASAGVRITALRISNEHGVRDLRGNVRIETANFVLTADQARYNSKSHDIYARGNVHVKLK